MSNTNKKLDNLLRRERHQTFRIYSVLFALFVVVSLCVAAYSTGETKIVRGEVTAFYSQASEQSEQFYITVKLDKDMIISLNIPREFSVRKGDTVSIYKRQTNLFNWVNYTFQTVVR